MSEQTTETTEPRVYIADLADYNAGTLTGFWMDLDGMDYQDALEAIREWQEQLPDGQQAHEEWAIHDHDGLGGNVGEWDLEEACTTAQAIEEHGEAWLAYVGLVGAHYATTEGFKNAFAGEHNSPEAYAEDYYTETGQLEGVPEFVTYHIDWEGVWRDMEMYAVPNGAGVYIFYSG